MEKIEERADAYCKEIFTHYEYMKPRTESLAKACYIDGATEQKKIDVDKALAIADKLILADIEHCITTKGKLKMLECIRKAMEE